MGKSKKRIFNKITEEKGLSLKRNEAVEIIVNDIKNKKINSETVKYINLFGISPEEILEYGVQFEDISAIKNLFY